MAVDMGHPKGLKPVLSGKRTSTGFSMPRKGGEAGIVSSGQSTKQYQSRGHWHLRLSAGTQSDLTSSQSPCLSSPTGPHQPGCHPIDAQTLKFPWDAEVAS